MTNRRTFLTGLLAASATPTLTWADAGNPSYMSAARLPDGSFALFGLSETGHDVFQIPLPGRGHAAAIHPMSPEAVAFARRPGQFALVINCATGRLVQNLDAPAGRHFYGHGSFINDGEILCTSENDMETGKGIIGLWARAENYRRIGEFYSGGIGPHELKTMPDNQTLVIANGGIRTHPNTGREKLNLKTMRPNLSLMNGSGNIIQKIELASDLHQNSIRHLDVSANGSIAFGMQWQGDQNRAPALVGVVQVDGNVQLLNTPVQQQITLQNYIGSVALSADGTIIGVTAPKGGRAHFYNWRTGFVNEIKRADVCGISASGNSFVTTDGNGGVFNTDGADITLLSHKPRSWDNHLVKIGKR